MLEKRKERHGEGRGSSWSKTRPDPSEGTSVSRSFGHMCHSSASPSPRSSRGLQPSGSCLTLSALVHVHQEEDLTPCFLPVSFSSICPQLINDLLCLVPTTPKAFLINIAAASVSAHSTHCHVTESPACAHHCQRAIFSHTQILFQKPALQPDLNLAYLDPSQSPV